MQQIISIVSFAFGFLLAFSPAEAAENDKGKKTAFTRCDTWENGRPICGETTKELICEEFVCVKKEAPKKKAKKKRIIKRYHPRAHIEKAQRETRARIAKTRTYRRKADKERSANRAEGERAATDREGLHAGHDEQQEQIDANTTGRGDNASEIGDLREEFRLHLASHLQPPKRGIWMGVDAGMFMAGIPSEGLFTSSFLVNLHFVIPIHGSNVRTTVRLGGMLAKEEYPLGARGRLGWEWKIFDRDGPVALWMDLGLSGTATRIGANLDGQTVFLGFNPELQTCLFNDRVCLAISPEVGTAHFYETPGAAVVRFWLGGGANLTYRFGLGQNGRGN